MGFRYWKYRLAAGILAGLLVQTAAAEASMAADVLQTNAALQEQTTTLEELEESSERVSEAWQELYSESEMTGLQAGPTEESGTALDEGLTESEIAAGGTEGENTSEDFNSEDFSSEDFTSNDFSSEDFSSEDFSSEDFNSEDFSSEDFSSEDFSSEDFTSSDFSSEEESQDISTAGQTTSEDILSEGMTLEQITEEVLNTEEMSSEVISSEVVTEPSIAVNREIIDCSMTGYTFSATPVYLKADVNAAAAYTMPEGTVMSVRSLVLENDEVCFYRVIFAMDEVGYEGYVRPDTIEVSGGISLFDLNGDVDQTDQFPEDYQVLIRALKEKYPNWIFQPLYTNLDFQYAVNQEQSLVNRNLVHISQIMDWKSFKSLGEDENGNVYNYNWQTDTWYEWEPSIVAASDESVAYCMDPRNFINEQYIFMFEDLSYHGEFQTVETVNALLKGTFMYDTNVPGEEFTYAWLLHWVGEKYGINPVMLASRLRQEQGIYGTSELISGTYEGYENLYNHFNIMASGKTREDIVTSGLTIAQKGSSMILPYSLKNQTEDEAESSLEDGSQESGSKETNSEKISSEKISSEETGSDAKEIDYGDEAVQVEEAYSGPWDTPTKSIIGGALNIATTFILVGQDSLYLQKFDVDDSDNKLFWHQYMQNVQAPMSESKTVKMSYTNMNLLEQPFVFTIPVFENMPASTPAPVSDLNPNNCLYRLAVNGKRVFTEFDKDVSAFTIEVGYTTEIASVEIIPAAAAARVEGSGDVSLNVGDNLHTFTVTAETGDVRTYTLNIIRLEEGVEEPTESPEDTELGYGELLLADTKVYIGLENDKKGSVYIPYYRMNASEDGQFIVIDGVAEGTNAETFLKNIDVQGNIWAGLFYGEDLTQKNGTDPVGTGMYLIISDHGTGQIVMCSPIIIYGDVTGDGLCNIVDFSVGKAQLLGRYTMTEEQQFASDLNGDGLFNIVDFSIMKAVLLGRYELIQ